MKKFHLACIILGSALLLYLIREIGINELWRELMTLGWGLVPLVLLEGVADIFHALAWRHCLTGPHRTMPLLRVFKIRMAGFSINYLTPTATLGGEVTKGTLLSTDHRGAGAATSVIIGKLAYTLAQLLFVAFGSIFTLWGIELPTGVWPAMLVSSSLLATGIFAFLLVQKYGKLGALIRWLVAHRVGGALVEKAAHHITEVDEELREFYGRRPWDLPFAMFWHTFGFICGIVQSWYFLSLLTDQASIRVAAGIWFLGTWFDFITFPVPLGIGIQEATRVLAFKAVGLDSLMGLTYGVTLRIEQIFWAGFGLLCYGLLLSEKEGKEPGTNDRRFLPLWLLKCRRGKE